MPRPSPFAMAFALALSAALAVRAARGGDPGPKLAPDDAGKVKELAALTGHKGAVFGIAFSPDGARLASASIDKSVRLWDVAAGTAGPVLAGHTGGAIGVAFSADDATLRSAGYDPAVRIWAVPAGTAVEAQTKNPKDENQRVSIGNLNGAFSPDGAIYVSSGDGGWILDVWDTAAKAARTIHFPEGTGATAHFRRVAFSGDGTRLAVQVDREKDVSTIELLDWKTSKWTSSLVPPEKAFVAGEALAVSADGGRVASVDIHTSRILVWDTTKGTVVATLSGHTHDPDEQTMIGGLAFSPDGRLLASISYDKTLRLWDVGEAKQAASLALPGMGTTVAFSPDGRRVATACLDGTVTVWGVPGP